MADKIKHITGSKDKGGDTRTPVEAPNTLRSKAVVRMIDVLGEGEIEGLANGDKSIYLDETPLQADTGEYNYDGITVSVKEGTSNQDPVPNFPREAASANSVSVQLTHNTPISRTINDSDVDHAQIILRVPSLQRINNTTGDINATSVTVKVYVNDIWVKDVVFSGKCVSPYQRTIRIPNLADNYGAAPWTIKCIRTTADSDSAYLQNDTYWDSYNTIIDNEFSYPYTAYVAATIDSQSYGTRIPARAYEVKGLKIQVPDNRYYDSATDTVTYSGTWSGTFKTEWCDNPAWIMYDILSNDRYGLGLDDSYIDKWELYTIGAYCDEKVEYDEDGSTEEERRFTFNGVIQTQEEAYHVIQAIAQCFRGMAYWATGYATFSQDRAKSATRLFTNANVADGTFSYEGTGLSARHTVVLVTWNDPDDLGNLATEVVEDIEGITNYGWRPLNTHAYGCTSRSQAQRFGKWILDSELHETEVVTFEAGWDAVDLMPGEIIKIADSFYTAKRWGGRLVSATTTELTLDQEIAFVGGNSYTVEVLTSSGTIMQEDLVNPGTTTDTVDIQGTLPEAPEAHSIFVITEANVEEPRPFRVLQNKEIDTHKYQIIALEYDENKFARVEDGIIFEGPPYSNLPAGTLSPPSNLQAEEYMYLEGGANNHKFGVQLGWTASSDVRTQFYELQKASISGAWTELGETSDIYFEDKPVTSGTYHYRVRGVYAAGNSSWATLDNFVIQGVTDGIGDITGLQVVGGGTTWTGRDCEIEWDDYPVTNSGILKDYKIQVYTTGDSLLRTAYAPIDQPYYTYTYEMNDSDNAGSPIRQIKFKVYARDYYLNLSQNPATDTMSNPAPDMSGGAPTLTEQYNQIKVDWTAIASADWDLNKYEIYLDTNNPPTTLQKTAPRNATVEYISNLDPDLTYYCKIRPYDLFGVGTDSAVSAPATPDALPGDYIDIEDELQDDILMSDSIGTTTSGLRALYDYDTVTSGVYYPAVSGSQWIEYDLPVGELINRVIIWADQDFKAYVKITDADDTVRWYKAEADHTLTSDGALVAATDESDCQTNYWNVTLTSNKAAALLPTRTVGKVCRLYIYEGDVNIRELVFERTVEAEQVVADTLAALSATIGNLENGTLQSTDWGANDGSFLDLTQDGYIKLGGSADPDFYWNGNTNELFIRGTVTFESGTTGYSGISDRPTSLSGVNETEFDHLTGIEPGADVTGNHTAHDTNYVNAVPSANIAGWGLEGDTTVIDGGNIWVGSQITLGEGAFIHFNDDSCRIDTAGTTTSIVVGEDGAIDSNGEIQDNKDYLIISDGDIKTFKWFNGAHREFKSLNKVAVGMADNNTTVNLGYFPSTPQILLSPATLQAYNQSYSAQAQYFNLRVEDLEQNVTTGAWTFTPIAELVLGEQEGSTTVGLTGTNQTSDCDNVSQTTAVTTPANTGEITFNVSLKSIHPHTNDNVYYYRKAKFRGVIGGAAQEWSNYSNLGATTDWVTGLSKKYYLASPGAYNIKVQGCGMDSGGTFSVGGGAYYEYDTTDTTTTVNDETAELFAYGPAGSDSDSETLSNTINMPSSPAGAGWEQYKIKYETNIEFAWCGNINSTSNGTVYVEFEGNNSPHPTDLEDRIEDAGNGDVYYSGWGFGYGGPYPSIVNTAGDDGTGCDSNFNTTTDTYTIIDTLNTSSTDTSHQLQLTAYAYFGATYLWCKISTVKVTRYWRRLVTQPTTKSNYVRFDSYNYKLSTATVLSQGTINYMAIG